MFWGISEKKNLLATAHKSNGKKKNRERWINGGGMNPLTTSWSSWRSFEPPWAEAGRVARDGHLARDPRTGNPRSCRTPQVCSFRGCAEGSSQHHVFPCRSLPCKVHLVPDPQSLQETELLRVNLYRASSEPRQFGGWVSTELAGASLHWPLSWCQRNSQSFPLQNTFCFFNIEPPCFMQSLINPVKAFAG